MKTMATSNYLLRSSFVVFVCFLCCGFSLSQVISTPPSSPSVTSSEGSITIPTYEHIGRELEPPLFEGSSVTGLYPFPTYLAPFRESDPKPATYRTILVENEYLKLTYIPELGGRFFSLYDKLRNKEVFYRNDVLKPTMFNPRLDWPQSGIELTGPYDVHTLTLHGEPFWSNTVVKNADGSVSLILGEVDPVFHMKVNLTATLYPGVAAMQISVFCYNQNDIQMPQMFWTNASFPATDKLRYIYPMTRTVGHTTGEVSDWPLYNGIDYSWDRNNKHMLGVFGIDSYDNFAGAYQFDHDYGVFRYADRRIVQGMKMWTFGYGPGAEQVQEGYTDHAGPYIEVQSGRHVWDGHYEWVAPHKVESWSEWWVPVSGIGGVTTMTRDVAINLALTPDPTRLTTEVKIALSPSSITRGAKLAVSSSSRQLLDTTVDLIPGTPVTRTISVPRTNPADLEGLQVRITDASGNEMLSYRRPDGNPGRKEYSPSAKALENPPKPLDKMSVEELTQAAEFKLKETNPTAMLELVNRALSQDPGYSRAHLLLGTYMLTQGKYGEASAEFAKATDRDPYLDEGWYDLAVSQLSMGDVVSAERNFYFVGVQSGYYGEREFQLGKLAFLRADQTKAVQHLTAAIMANGNDLNARILLAIALRTQGKKREAADQLDALLKIDPSDRFVYSERYFATGDDPARGELLRLMGAQSQEAIDVANLYASIHHWAEAAAVLKMVAKTNKDPWGTSPLFYYTLAYDLEQAGDSASAANLRKEAQAASKSIDRFPYRRESEAPLEAAVIANSRDSVARFNLGCLLYFLERPVQAIEQWKQAVELDPGYFSAVRALGLSYAASGKTDLAAATLEQAIRLRPDHIRTLNDLSSLYARAGKSDAQVALLDAALQRSPDDDDLVMALLNAYLITGQYKEADRIVTTHVFAPRHRSTILRDEYRNLRYGMGAVAYDHGDYPKALALFQSALKPPVSLGVDDFQFQSTPKAYYLIGRTLDALNRHAEAVVAYQQSTRGIDLLSGDRDSWNSENFYALLSLEKLGQQEKAKALLPHFDGFARTEMDETNPVHRGQARFLLALIAKHAGEQQQARKLMNDSVQALPDFLLPRYELRGDVIDPIEGTSPPSSMSGNALN